MYYSYKVRSAWGRVSVNSCNKLAPAVVSLAGEEPETPGASGGVARPPGAGSCAGCAGQSHLAPGRLRGVLDLCCGKRGAQAELGLGELHEGSQGRWEGRSGGHLRAGSRMGSPKYQ